jgi:hypothetical protein
LLLTARTVVPATYEFGSDEVETLVRASMRSQWNVEQDLPWQTAVDVERITPAASETLLRGLPEFEAMTERERRRLALAERVYHLSNLLAGEHRAVSLTAQIIVDAPQERSDVLCFGSFVLSDERNHYLALHRYLKEKVGCVYAPHPKLVAVMDALTREGAFEVKLFVAQVALEWTAASLLATLTMKDAEPLLDAILRKVLADEGRHLRFNRWAMKELAQGRRVALQPAMEDLFFEAILATTSSFFAHPAWQEFGLSQDSCRAYARDELARRDVLRYYARILPAQLDRCGFASPTLTARLERELGSRLADDHWSFHPVAEGRLP